MTLAAMLRLLGFNRSTFNTLVQTGALTLLNSARTPDGWNLEPHHVLAFAAFVRLRDMGVPVSLAQHAVAGAWPAVIAAANGKEGPNEIGIYKDFSSGDEFNGIGFIGQADVIDEPEGEIVSRSVVHLRALARYLDGLAQAA
jgi:hypothetical protein